jgi:ligand-binding sensor domain-containing protein
MFFCINSKCVEESPNNSIFNPESLSKPNGEIITAVAINNDDVWVGTYNGLVKLNKRTGLTIHYNKTNTILPKDKIESIAIESGGVIWANVYHPANGYCLIRYNGLQWNMYSPLSNPDIIDTLHFSKICIDQNGNKWVFGNRLARLDASFNWKLFDSSDSVLFNSGYIRSCVSDKNGNLFIGNDLGIVQYDGKTWVSIKDNFSTLDPTCVIGIAIDNRNVLWTINEVGSSMNITFLGYVDKSKLIRARPNFPSNCIATCIVPDNDNGIWIGTENRGLLRSKDSTITEYKPDTESQFQITAIAVDKNGDVWLGTYGYGLVRFDGRNWYTYDLFE